jgi:hypothetical protein
MQKLLAAHGFSKTNAQVIITYDHRLKRTGHPVRSAIHNLEIGGLVVGWVTTSEYPLLYVFAFFINFFLLSSVADLPCPHFREA